jgi:PAS domain S-box-containing protein
MFDLHNLRAMLVPPEPPGQEEMDLLRDRIVELEAENANLHRLDDTIQRNARLFDAILQRSHEGILLLTPDLIVLRLIHSSVGYQQVELCGQPVLSLIHPDDAGCLQNSLSQILSAQAKSVACEFRLKKKDGSWAWVAAEMTDMLDDPDVQAILLNARNITEQKKLAAAAETLESFRAVSEYAMFSNSLDGIILDWNLGAEQAFGYSVEEIVGQNVAALIPSALLSEEIATRERIARGEEVIAFETTRNCKDGRSVEIHLKLAPVRESHGRVRAITHFSRVIG